MFKKGDRARIVGDTCSHNFPIGSIRIVTSSYDGNKYNSTNEDGFTTANYFMENDAVLVEAKKIETPMKNKFLSLFLKEPEKSFRQAKITGDDGFLTADGQAIFLQYLLSKNGDAFKTDVVDGLIAEDAKNSK